MKLVDILARELNWPNGAAIAVQDYDGEVKFSESREVHCDESSGVWIRQGEQEFEIFDFWVSDDQKEAVVTKEEWQAAVNALSDNYQQKMFIQQGVRIDRAASKTVVADSREQFEQAYSEDNGGVPVSFLVLDRLGDSYGTPKVARAYYWWKRARAGVVVVLPADSCDPGWNAAIRDSRKAIEDAGMQVAP